MAFRIIKLSYPEKAPNEPRTFISEIEVSKNGNTVYDAVSFFEKNMLPTLQKKLALKKVEEKVALRDILNIHNDDAIRDLAQVRRMTAAIKSGKHIFFQGIPNVKLVKTKDNQLLLFDGHHSMLAYMNSGKTYLEEIPHMIIADEDKGYIEDKDIVVFYGEHAKAIKNYGWKQYVINWQAVKEKQLCRRVQRDMGELFCAIKDRIK
ncbi:MAG: hypothetical protein JW883_13445 [Deltaproteobacteria bacterium]|nr:hypothetical protein [Deltaproteobacteria bacterium]